MAKTVRLWCAGGAHWWERPSQRGKRPKNCAEHAGLPATSSFLDDEIIAERVPDDGKAHRLVLTTAQEQEELATLRRTLPGMTAEYDTALTAACAARTANDTKHRFDVADSVQDRILGVLHRMRKLEALIS